MRDEAFETATRGPGSRPGAGGLGRYRPRVVVSMLAVTILVGGTLYAARLSEGAKRVIYTASLEEVEDDSRDSLQVDINIARVEELDELPEVGPSTAESIIEYRQNNGQFTSVDDLEGVPGSGPRPWKRSNPLPRSRGGLRAAPNLDLRPPVRLDLWALTLAAGVVAGTVAPPLTPMLVLASAVGALLSQNLVPPEWRLMVLLGPVFAAGGGTIAVLHAATPDPLTRLAALEPGEVVLVGTVASPHEQSSYSYRADVRVEHLWNENREVLRGGAWRCLPET